MCELCGGATSLVAIRSWHLLEIGVKMPGSLAGTTRNEVPLCGSKSTKQGTHTDSNEGFQTQILAKGSLAHSGKDSGTYGQVIIVIIIE